MNVNQQVSEFAADWTGTDALEARLVNQILAQVGVPEKSGPDGVYLTFGVITPPVIVGRPDIIEAQVAAYDGKLPVKPVVRIRLTREKTAELHALLGTTLEQYDAQAEAAAAAARVEAAGGTGQ